MSRRRVGLQISDPHGGAKHGLASSTTKLNGALLGLSSVQLDLETLFFEIIESVTKFANGDPVDVHLTGDAGNGASHSTTEALITPDPQEQAYIIAEVLQYLHLCPNVDSVALEYGTKAHDWAQNAVTETLAQMLIARGFRNVTARPHTIGWYDDVLIDAAHHGPSISPAAILRYLTSTQPGREGLIPTCIEENREIPHLVLRGHRHIGYKYVHEYKVLGQNRKLIYLAGFPMCAINDFARQVTNQAQRFVCGAWMWEQIDGEIPTDTIQAITKTFDTRSVIYRGSATADGRGVLAHVRRGAGNRSRGDGMFG